MGPAMKEKAMPTRRRRLCAGFRALRDARAGATAVEFAILASVTLMIAFAIIELGRLAFTQYSLERAVRVGVRYAVVSGAGSTAPATATTVRDKVLAAVAEMGLTRADATVGSNPFPAGNAAGKAVVVGVTYTYRPVLPTPLASTLTLQRSMQATILN